MAPSQTKNPAASTGAPDISIVGDQVSLFPSGYTQSSESQSQTSKNDTHDRNLVEHMARFRESPLDFLKELNLHVQGSGWRSYDHIVGQPVFYNGFSENMKAAVLDSSILRRKVTELAQRRVDVEAKMGTLGGKGLSADACKAKRRETIESSLKELADKMTDDMICKMESRPFIRSAYYLVTQLLTRAYHQGIHVSSEEVLRLRGVAEKAAKNNQSIIFLPCHRSHVDYVSLQLVCYRLGLTLPTVVAGDNLNFPLVGPFLQHAGAMWIRRSFGDDQLYNTLVQSYIDTLLQKGYNFECFIEGGRSRMGKLLPPKFGILSFILDSLLSGRVKDAIICPVSTQYDKVIEVDSYISELLGTPKSKENLSDFLSASSILSLKLGRVDMRFHEPWSLRGFVDEQQRRFDALSITQQTDLNRIYSSNLRIRLLRTLGYKVLADINAVSVVMPTSLIGTVLLTLRGRGTGKSDLIRRVEWLSERVRAHGGRVAHFAGLETATVVERGLEVLGPRLVGVQKNLAEETYFAEDRFQLSFYRNMTIHLFISEALVAAGMYTQVKAGSAPETQAIEYQALVERVRFLSQLFRGEFIFATQGLATNLAQTLAGLESDGVIKMTKEEVPAHQVGSEQPTTLIKRVELSDAERADGRNNFDFYCFLIWPFVEASWLGAVSLLMLTPPTLMSMQGSESSLWLDMKVVQDKAQWLGKTLYAQGEVSYFESVNKETLKNAYTRFEEEGIIISKKAAKGSKGPSQMVRLAGEWTPQREGSGLVQPSGRLWDFCEEISQYRVEGKHRRDSDDVVARVLRLVETVGKGLWEQAVVDPSAAGSAAAPKDLVSAEERREREEKRRRAPLRTRASL